MLLLRYKLSLLSLLSYSHWFRLTWLGFSLDPRTVQSTDTSEYKTGRILYTNAVLLERWRVRRTILKVFDKKYLVFVCVVICAVEHLT